MRTERITASLKRSFYGPTLKKADDYTMREVNSLLTDLLGKPGMSAGKAQQKLSSQISSGMESGAYSSAQADYLDSMSRVRDSGRAGGSSFGTAAAAGVGLLRDLLGYYYADKSAQTAYNRQNEFYDNHLSMPAKVQEYQEAGLNPMGLAGVGAGATSAPSVQPASAPGGDGIMSVLSSLLDYKVAMRRADIEERRVSVEEQKLPSMIEQAFANAENRRKQVEWYDTAINKMNAEITQIGANVDKIFAETDSIDAGTFLLRIRGAYAERQETAQLLNLYKDLGVKDSQISKNDADAALAWSSKNLTDITSQYQGALMEANTSASLGRAVVSYSEAAVKQFEVDYMRMHNGAAPPSGMVGAVIGLCSAVANRITGVAPDPNYGVSVR